MNAILCTPETRDRIATACDRLKETLQRKNADYGDSAFLPPLLTPELDANTAILVRMSDKIRRIIHLEQNATTIQNESLADSYLDLAGYAILRLIALEQGKI